MQSKTFLIKILNWLFGLIFLAIGIINTFWGNDMAFGVFIFLLSFLFIPPTHSYLQKKTGFKIHPAIFVIMGLFIIWAALGVGELFAKIDLMLQSF